MAHNNGATVRDAKIAHIWQTSPGTPGSVTRTFRTTFVLGGELDALTATITGQWSTDNLGLDIRINGVRTGTTSPGCSTFTDAAVDSDSIGGLNTLDFAAPDRGPPGALDVRDLQGIVRDVATPKTTVPEPATMVLMGSRLAALGSCAARRQTQA